MQHNQHNWLPARKEHKKALLGETEDAVFRVANLTMMMSGRSDGSYTIRVYNMSMALHTRLR